MILDTDPVTFGTQNLSFGRPGAPLWHPGGPWGDPGDTWEHKKGDLAIPTCIFMDFRLISGPHFESFSDTVGKNMCFCSCLFPGSFFERFVGLNLDVWVPKTSIWCEMGNKNQVFMEVGILLILGSNFDVFGWLWDQFA